MVNIYAIDVSNLPDPKHACEAMDGLSRDRKERILRYRQEKDRKQCLGAGILLKECFKEYHINIEEIRYGKHGKPEADGIYFNLSHSQDMVVCAVSDRPVGCDIEKIREYKESVAKKVFTEKERYHLEKFQGNDKRDEFYRLWTMKESYIKMTGEGMSLALDSFEFRFEEQWKVYRDGKVCSCNIKEYDVPGYKMTVCSECKEDTDKISFMCM